MRKPSSPLRRVLAVCLSLLILPWQQPALALAESSASGAIVSGVKLDHPREVLDALDLKLAVLLARIKSDDLMTPALTAALPEDLAKLKTGYKAAQDNYIAAEKEAPDAAKPELKALSAASTGQLIVEAVVEADLGGVRKDLAGMLASEVSLSRRPDQIPESDWAAVEKAAPDFNAGLLPLSSRVEKVRNQPPYAVKDVEDAYRPLADALDASFQNLRGRASRIDIAGLLAAKPKTASGDAAGALMAEVARALPADKAALLKPQLAAVNTKLAGYLHSGNPADLTSALAEIDRLYDAANIKKIDRADMFDRIGNAAQARAQTSVPAASGAAIQFSVVPKAVGIDSKDVPLPAVEPGEKKSAPAASSLDADARLAMQTAMSAMGHIMPDGDPAKAALDALSAVGVPGSNSFVSAKARELSEMLLGRAAGLKREDADEKAAKGLADAYALIEARVTSVVLDAPDRTLDPAPADAEKLAAYNIRWEKNSADQLKKLKAVEAELTSTGKTDLGVTGPGVWGWSEALLAGTPALVPEAAAKALAPARARAKKLVDLISSLRHQHEIRELDLTTPKWGKELRLTILYADGKGAAGDLGATGNAVVIQTVKERESLEKAAGILARFKAVTLTGDPAADRAALDSFFDKAENKADNLPPMMSDWVRVRDFDRGNAKLKAEGKPELPRPPGLPGTDETYRRFVVADRYERIKAIPDPTQQQMAQLHETYFAMNRAAYIALGCDPAQLAAAEGSSGSAAQEPAAGEAQASGGNLDPKEKAAFCSGFLANARRPETYDVNGFYAQKKLADQIKPFLNDNELAKAAANLGTTTAEMQRSLRAMSPELRAKFSEKGVDVEGILNQGERGQVLRWAVVVDQLKTAGDDAGWRAYSDVVIRNVYGDKTDLATKAQSNKMRAAAASEDAAGMAASLGDIQNPAVLTNGYLAALPKMLGSERSRRSARDRALLFMWNGGAKKGEAPAENTYAGLLLAVAGQYEADAAKPENKEGAAELKRLSALMREVAADPSDPEKSAEALRAAGRPVFDARAVRVGMDTTKVPAEPGTEEEKRDYLTARSLAALFLSKGESFLTAEGAAKIRSGLLKKIGGELADSQEQNRRDQLIRSASDEHQDRIAKLGVVSGEMLAEAGAGGGESVVARRRIEGSASYRELLGVANSVKSYQNADLELYNVTEKLAATAWGRASMTLPGLLASAQAQSSLTLRSAAGPNGLTLSGWMVGLPDIGDVTRENGHKVPLPEDEKPRDPKVVDGLIMGNVPTNLPKGPLNGFTYRDAKGRQIFTSLNGDYQETSMVKTTPLDYDDGKGGKVAVEATVMRGTKLDKEGKPAPFDFYRQGKGTFVRVERVRKGPDGAEQIYYERVPVTAADGITGGAPVNTTFITMREGSRTVVASVDRDGSGALLRWRASYDKSEDYIEVDRAGRSQTVRAGSKVMVFSLTEDGTGLAASRNRQTFEVVGGNQVLKKVEYFDLVKKSPTYGRMMVETPLQGDVAGVTVIRSFGGATRLASLTAEQRDAIILGKSKERFVDDPAATSYRVQADRNGMTPEKLAKFYSNVAHLVKNDIGLTAGTGKAVDDAVLRAKFASQFVGLAAFFDGQAMGLGKDATPQGGRAIKPGASSVSFDIGQGGSVSASSSGFDRGTLRVERSNSTQFTFVSLPENAPHIEHGKPLTGLDPNDKLDKAILDSILSQELAAVRQALGGQDSGFVIFDGAPGKPTTVGGFFGSHNGKEGVHSFSMVDTITNPHDKDNGFAYITSSDLVRRFRVDNRIAGEVKVGGTTAVSNAGEHWGASANNRIRYSPWGRANPTTAAVLGGLAGGVVSAVADWKLLALTVAMGGSNIIAGVLVRTTSTFLVTTGKIIQYGARGFDLYFKYEMGVGAYQSVGALNNYAQTGDVDKLNEGIMGLTAAGVGLYAGHKIGKLTQGLGVKLEGRVESYLKGRGIEVIPKGGAAPNAAGDKNEPAKNEPAKNEPAKNEPVKNEPVKNEPVKNEPVKNEPVRNEPVRNEPVRNEPSRTEPARTPNGEAPRPPVERTPPPTPRAPTMMGRLAQSLGFSGGTLNSPNSARATGEGATPGGTKSSANSAVGEAPASAPKSGPSGETAAAAAPKAGPSETVAKAGAPETPAAKAPAPESARAETAKGGAAEKAGGAEKNAGPNEVVSSEFIRPLAPEIAASRGAPEGLPSAAEGIMRGARPEGPVRGMAKEGAVKEGVELVEPVARPEVSKRARIVEREPAAERAVRDSDASSRVPDLPVRGLEPAKGAQAAKGTEPAKIVEPSGNVDAALAAKPGASATTADAAPPTGAGRAPAAKPTRFQRFSDFMNADITLKRITDFMDADIARTKSDFAPARQLGRWVSGKGEGAMAKLDGVEILGLRASDVVRAPKLLGLGVEKIGSGLTALGTKFSSGMSGLARLAGFEGLASRLAPRFNEYGQRIGVDGHPVPPGFISSMFHDAGGLLQGRFMAAPPGGRPATIEELRYPKLADRPSFREALTAEVRSAGGEVAGRYDPATQKVTFGPKASGPAEIIVEVRPGADGAVEITGYRVKAADPTVEARAHGEATSLLQSTFRMDRHQASLQDAFASKGARAELARNLDATGETYLDLAYDAPGGRLSVAGKPGAGDVRVRLRAGEDGALAIGEIVALKEGAKIPNVLRENLNVFAARETVSIAEKTGEAARPLTPEELGARLVERLKAERVRYEQENVERTALSESRVKGARTRLDAAQTGAAAPGTPELATVRGIARKVAELRIERETSDLETAAADRHLETLKISKKAVLRAEEALGARERAGRELDKVETEHRAAQAELNALAQGDVGRPAAQARLREIQVRGREVAERFRVVDENAARTGAELTESAVDALVRRQAASQKIAVIEAAGRVAMGELRTAVREARGGKQSSAEQKAAVREALANERLAAAEFARAEEGGIREYQLNGLHSSGGGGGRRVVMMRLLAEEGALKGGRSSVGQEAGKNLCVVATAADMVATALGRPASRALAEAEAAIIAHHKGGPEAGRAFLRDVAKSGMSRSEIREMMGAVAEASGLKLVEIPAESLFVKLAQGGQIAIVMTHVADSAAGFNGGSHMVNLSNWRQARNPVTGRVETMVDVADPNIRVLSGRSPGGAPIYEAKTVSMPLSEIAPEIRGSLRAENGNAAGYAFEPAAGAGPRGPPARPVAELVARMGGTVGSGSGAAVAGVKSPAGFESRGHGKVIDPTLLPVEIYSKEIVQASREHGLVYELDAASLGRMKPGVKHNYVISRSPDGMIEMTVGRLAEGNVKEVGVKHVALGDGRPVLFAGEMVVDPVTGRPRLDFKSGMYSQVGLDARWAPTAENARALAVHAEAILGSPVEIFNHVSERSIDVGGATPSGVGMAASAPVRSISRGESRRDWTVNGRPAERLSAGGFKEVLIHPSDAGLVIKLFSLTGGKDAAGSRSEMRLEMRNLEPLLKIERTPRVVEKGEVDLQTASSGKRGASYIVQERVIGREIGEMLRDPSSEVRARAIKQARALFEDLISARVKLEDRVKMHENISVGRAGKGGLEKAWVLDAGEATLVAKRGMLDGLLGKADPLRVYYESVLTELSGLSRTVARGTERGRGVGTATDVTRYERYFSPVEIKAAHPTPKTGEVYHNLEHTLKVADMAGEFARARGLGEADVRFVSEVALLHDFDAARVPGKPARVLATLESLRADFAGTMSLNGEPGRSVLKERFKWSESQLKMAEAMIQRTEFPFAEKHPNPAYAEKSPLARYDEMLTAMSPGDRRFVLREAALLSEYADKSSWYATAKYEDAHKAVEGLVNEIGVPAVTIGTLGTNGFLKVIGEPASFTHDMALAKKFDVKLTLQNRAEAFKLLPEHYGRTFEANLKGFTEFDAAMKAGDPAAYEKARAVAAIAAEPAARRAGVGSSFKPVPDSATAVRLRGEQKFARTPDYPNSPVFTENSVKANDFFNRWLNGQEGTLSLRQTMESMHKLYAGQGEIGKGLGGQYMPEGAPNNGRAKVTRDFVRDYFGLEANPDGHVSLPGIPKDMSPLFLGSRYFYPDSSIPGMRETYYKALETHLATYSELVNRIDALKARDPNFKTSIEYQALTKASLDTVVDFGRTAAAFRQFKNGNWGLYGPMMNSMVNRLGFSIKNPGYLDIILQGATEGSIKPFFEKAVREGVEFFPSDGYDPIKGKVRAPDAPQPVVRAPSAPRDVYANAPAVVRYEGPIRLRIGGEGGKTLEILSRADLAKSFPDVARLIGDPRIEHVLIDPAKPEQIKGLRRGEVFELGRKAPGRFELTPSVSGKHLRITGEGDVLRIEDLGSSNGTRLEVPSRAAGVGSGGGLLSRVFGGRSESMPAVPEKIIWPVEAGGPVPARLDFTKLKLDGPLKNREAVHTNVIAVELGGRKAVLKIDAKPNEARVLAAMAEVPLPANVRVPRLLGDAPADAMGLFSVTREAPGAVDYAAVKRAAAEGRHMLAVERLPDDFVSMMQVTNGSVKLKAPISRGDWQGLLDAVKSFSRRGMGFGDLGNETNIRLRQVPDGNGGVKTEFALIDAGQGTLKGKMETLNSDFVQLKGDRALETRLLERNLLEGRGALPDPRLAAIARNQVPQSQKFAVELNALMKGGGERPSAALRAESHRFTDLAQAAAYLKAPEGMQLLEKTSEGLAGDTVKVEVGGQDWYLKRVSKKLGDSIDTGLRELTPRERAGNELALREVVRRWFPETFRVAPEAIAIEHGGEIFVLTRGAPAAPAPARLQTMTAAEHADYALLRLVFRAEDLNRGNVLFGKDGKPTLIDFEKVIAAPLDPASVARGANAEIFLKGFPVVSLKGNDLAVYRAHADKLRARFASPEHVAELTGVLERAGWTPERTASYLKAIEINLRNFEVNLAPYIAEANTVIAKRPQGVGAADSFFDGPPDAVRARQSADKPSPLRQIQVSLEARGKGDVFKEAEAIYYKDALTGLNNRAFLMANAESLLKGMKDPTVAMLDMNNFGAVNAGLADVHGPVAGREMGDAMLAAAGPKIAEIARKAGVQVARLGGEEIVVLGSQKDVVDFAAAMRKAFPPNKVLSDAKLVPGGREWNAIDAAMARMQRTGPMGDFTYGLARTEGRSFEAALKAADGVLNTAKAEGLRGAAVMEVPGSLTFTRLHDSGSLAERVSRLAELPPIAQRPERLKAILDLKARLTEKEYAVFLEAAYKDPLSLTKTAEWIDMARPQWEAAYEGRGSAAMLSARNFKAVNDVLGHDAGDMYLKKLGVIMRVEVNRLRKLGYSVEEPVRVGGKEFLLVGKDAAKVAGLVGEKFVAKLNAGEVLPAEQLARLREEAPARGLIPKDRVRHLGDLRMVDEPFSGGFKKTYERLILELESGKLREDQAPVTPKPKGVGAGSDPGRMPGGLSSGLRSAAGVHYHGKDVVPAALNPAHQESMKLKRLHLKSDFLTETIDHGRAMIHEAVPIPGLAGFELVVYRRFQAKSERQMTDKLRAKYEFKTVVGPEWTPARIDELGRKLFGHETATNKEVYATLDGVEYVGWIRNGVLTSFGVKRWPGMPDFASRYGPPPPSLKEYLNLAAVDASAEAAFAAYQANLHGQDMVGALREVRALSAGLSDPAAKTLLGSLEAKLAPLAEAQSAQRERLRIR